MNKARNIIETLKPVYEFKEDLGRIAVVMMGLPASGKSTFIKTDMLKVFPGVKQGFKVANSDVQLKAFQYKAALFDWKWLLKSVNGPKDLEMFARGHWYTDNSKKKVSLPITWEWWVLNKDKGADNFYKDFKKDYYNNYFDLRDYAVKAEKDLFATKIKKAGNIIILDTVASKPEKILKRLKALKKEGYTTVVIYLDIVDPNLSIVRDTHRKLHSKEGRGVGADVILGYFPKMDSAYETYKANGASHGDDSVVDRTLKFAWMPKPGGTPIQGKWKKMEDNRFSLRKKLLKIKKK